MPADRAPTSSNSGLPADASNSGLPADAPYRLPRNVEPRTYRLTLEPDLDAATFTGEVEVDLVVTDATDRVVCNAAELAISDVAFVTSAGHTRPATVELDEAEERATFALAEPLPTGPTTLRCRFEGILNDRLHGFYRSTFTDDSGTTHTIATTQMESTDARRAFPCWDEPDRKAVFEVTLVVEGDLAAYSNSPVIEETQDSDGRRRVRFAPTMVMSTYLVAFIVGRLDATDPVDVDGVPVRVVHVPGKAHLTPYALEVATHALRFFRDYFDIPYPADKLDLVAIPDFAFGAMENLGCVTFRETALLADPQTAARTELERVADVICHEIAHMWFGDLVTMRWWHGIWLNEAFATFMEVLACDAFRPEWRRWVSFCADREAAMAVDSLHTTRPIEYPVGRPEEAEGMFDVLTYEKGGSVLRMLEQYLGAEVFRDGVRAYLRAHAYGNTDTADLWDALESVSRQPVRAMMDTWILQGGFPLVTVEDGRLGQQPFTIGPVPEGQSSAVGGPWEVPVLVRHIEAGAPDPEVAHTAGSAPPGPSTSLLLDESGEPLPDRHGGIPVVNAGGWGFYRIDYPPEHLAQLARAFDALTTLERSNLVSDTWALTYAGRIDLAGFLDLAAHLGNAEDPSTWLPVIAAIDLLDRVIGTDDRPALAAAAGTLLGPAAAALGWDPRPSDNERTAALRAMLIRALGTVARDPAIRAEAARRFDAATAGPEDQRVPIDADIEGAVLDVVADQLRPGDFDTVLERYRHPATPQEESRYLGALASFPDLDLAGQAFGLSLDEVRTQNAPYLIMSLLANRVAGPAMWDQLAAHWSTVLERFPSNSHSRMLAGIRVLCAERSLAARVAGFLAEHPLRSGQRSVDQAVERLWASVAFGERQRPTLRAMLTAVRPG